MRDWLETLDKFTGDFGFAVLEVAGTVSRIEADEKAHREYKAYRAALPDDLTDVEKAYLDTLKDMQKRLKDGGGDAMYRRRSRSGIPPGGRVGNAVQPGKHAKRKRLLYRKQAGKYTGTR